MTYNPRDRFFKKAKSQNYVARSIFKLEEIDQKLKIFKSNQRVLDLGCFPGSWSQYASKKIGSQGFIFGVDLKRLEITLPNAEFVVGDMLEMTELPYTDFDVVMSDMAPSTTGIKFVDQTKSLELCEMALTVAKKNLKPQGHFICKLFHGQEFDQFKKQLKNEFVKIEALKPESTRKESKEIFLIGLKYRG